MEQLQAAPAASAILIITILISWYTLSEKPELIRILILQPWTFFREKRYYTLLTSGFIHADYVHLMLNMFVFYFFAFPLEPLLGHERFLIVYLGSMVLSDIPTLVRNKDNRDYRSLGASGAVSGVVFSFILFYPKSKIYLFLLPLGIPAYLFAILYLLSSYYLSRKQLDNVNHSAHFWGGIIGIILTVIMVPAALHHFLYSL